MRNSKEKGDIALAHAIGYYMANGFEVCVPLGDKRPYDLVVEKKRKLMRVQVKYAGRYGRYDRCYAGLRITGGNKSVNTVKKYSSKSFELLYVLTARGTAYNIPWNEVEARSELSVESPKYYKYRVGWGSEVVKRT